MTSQRHYSFSIPEELDGLIDFVFVRSLFLGIPPLKYIKKSDIKILVHTPMRIINNFSYVKHQS